MKKKCLLVFFYLLKKISLLWRKRNMDKQSLHYASRIADYKKRRKRREGIYADKVILPPLQP